MIRKFKYKILLSSLKDISRIIRPGNLIVIRSTVGVGTTRDVIIPELEDQLN